MNRVEARRAIGADSRVMDGAVAMSKERDAKDRLDPGNKWRKILDCRKLNSAIIKQHFQMEDLITTTQTIKQGDFATQLDLWMIYHHLKVSEDLQRNMSESNHGEVQRESGIINGRPTDLIVGKEIAGIRYSLDYLIHEGARLEDVISQIQGNINEGLSIPWLEMEDLNDGSMHSSGQVKIIEIKVEKIVRVFDGGKGSRCQEISTTTGRVEFSGIANNGFFSIYGINQPSKNGCVQKPRMK
ncbi:MAG: hypothetical protein EZS28_008685 [Streblomastix strix]|uniref:Uncharacterized protein n=1 Tax=Streblomastix strix TaxID=222440 RepID=A0A5J4WLG4_9EUKA|nr:MAG: hypothetical protein EZS28_008685 [Streblomastix strix]